MKNIIVLICFLCVTGKVFSKEMPKTIHVFVALCDNTNQGIVPVPQSLGNGQEPKSNLYWGAMYGVKNYFKRNKDWELISTEKNAEAPILERILFKHKYSETYLLADAYDGKYIKQTTIDFLQACSGVGATKLKYNNLELSFGGASNLISYVGHDGLMEFEVEGDFDKKDNKKREAIILACVSKTYFKPYILKTQAAPLLWTTGLMAPEAYTLKAAIDGWILKESSVQIKERAAKTYHKYQKCGLRAAQNLLVTGY
jgi:hypothetical protein